MTIRTERGRQIIFPSCTASNIGNKIPNYLYSGLEHIKVNAILALYNIPAQSHYHRFLLKTRD